MDMKRLLMLVGVVTVVLVSGISAAPEETAGKIMTLPGYVKLLDLETNTIVIDGYEFRVHTEVQVTRGGEKLAITDVSAGAFVIATVKESAVLGLTVIPAGQGF